jgi:flavin-binding protein dodecin
LTARRLRTTIGFGALRAHDVGVDERECLMADSVYKVVELVGTSTDSWEKAAAAAIDQAGSTLRDLRIAEVKQLDVALDEGGAKTYRAKLSVSFKYEGGG